MAGGCEEAHQLPGGGPAGQEAAHLRPGDVVQPGQGRGVGSHLAGDVITTITDIINIDRDTPLSY